jgi:hypothetical protein
MSLPPFSQTLAFLKVKEAIQMFAEHIADYINIYNKFPYFVFMNFYQKLDASFLTALKN